MIVVGRVEPLKGTDVLLKALSRLPLGCQAYRLLLVGPVEPSYREKQQAQAIRLGVADRIEFVGYQSPVHPWISAGDLLVHPSLYEAFPRVILEAMALSKPVVASRVGGVPEAVVDGETGLLVPAEDADALTAALQRCIANAAFREQLGEAGRQLAERLFSAEGHARRVEEEYQVLLEGTSP